MRIDAKLPLFTFILFTVFFISSSLAARQPAVEPVMGISIDDMPKVPLSEDPGYAFKETSKPQTKSDLTPHEASVWWPQLLILLVLPVLIVSYARYRFSKTSRSYQNNTVDLKSEREKRSRNTDHDDDEFKKAS